MYLLSQLLSHLILPPGLFILLLLAAGVLLHLDRRKASGLLLGVATLGLYLLSVSPVKDLLLQPLENAYPYPDGDKLHCDAIVIHGGGLGARDPSANGLPSLKGWSLRRMHAGAALAKRFEGAVVILAGGQGRDKTVPPESHVLAEYLKTAGIRPDRLVTEDQSRNTRENVLFVRSLLDGLRVSNVCVVTSAFHLPRTMALYERLGLDVTPIPCDIMTGSAPPSPWDWLPTMAGLRGSALALHEYLGLVYYRLRGWI
ncbi:YdcF family protein [Desulfoglaeba alkanexedens]|uniref:YdcF family protein n=1 Tax=Desulfoglaeba alkanexedens ALDC TaxID=980445 RepID=A0A4P8L1F0_9BACT|nr:YdcF family protein [Desulfoglaeba alkanexedens]QCQ21687.1 YdcF family protein [Desulfoglaeba alkanexedens ALDC]